VQYDALNAPETGAGSISHRELVLVLGAVSPISGRHTQLVLWSALGDKDLAICLGLYQTLAPVYTLHGKG
jgi:hypothetical protein